MIKAPFSCCSRVAIFENCSGSSSTRVPAALTAIATTAVVLIGIVFSNEICAFNVCVCFLLRLGNLNC